MIECIFTVDYEIYGNGKGSLKELVHEPAERLIAIFRKWNARFVFFVEAAELELIESKATDPGIDLIKAQIGEFHRDGFELGLHLHPWWYNGRYENGKWILDQSEYNLCSLPRERIVQMVDRSIAYLRDVLGLSDFTPLSYRAGHLLFQPSRTVAGVLAERGIKVDSSVYKGGLWHQHKLDYRRALKNGYYWKFTDDANVPDPQGCLLELPIYTQMISTWKMFTARRVGLQRNVSSTAQVSKKMASRLIDFLRFWYPCKFDICSMSLRELTIMVDAAIREDQKDPASFRPIVAIGHTKELIDIGVVDSFLSYLRQKGIPLSTFAEVYKKCQDIVDI